MKNAEVDKLNEYIRQELGSNPYGAGMYCWEFSNDLMWPAFATGNMVEKATPSGLVFMDREYVQARQTEKQDCWIVTKWCAPEELPDWQKTFPGAAYPARGYRIPTDWYNAAGVLPRYSDTQKLIWCLREQAKLTKFQLGRELQEEMDERDQARDAAVDTEVEDYVPAFVNATPGKRGGYVSVPGTKQDRMRDGSSLIQ